MKSHLLRKGKGKFQRFNWEHTAENPMEKVILELLKSLEDIDHAEFMSDTTDIVICHEYAIMKEEIQRPLNHVLA